MKKLRYLLALVTLFAFQFTLVSCTEEQNFDQIEDLSLTPTLSTGIFYLESDEASINQAGPFNSFYFQEVNFDAFNEEYVSERLLEGTILYELENTTSKQLRVTIDFLSEDGQVLDTEVFNVPANTTDIITREVYYGPGGKSLDILINTSGLRISGNNLSDSSSVSSNEDPKVILRSGAEFEFELL